MRSCNFRHAYQTKGILRGNRSITSIASSEDITSDPCGVTKLHCHDCTFATCRHVYQTRGVSRGNRPITSIASSEAITSDSCGIATLHCHNRTHATQNHVYQRKVISMGNRSISGSISIDLIISDSRVSPLFTIMNELPHPADMHNKWNVIQGVIH